MEIRDCACGDCLNVVVDGGERRFCFACEDSECAARHADGKPECNVAGAYDNEEDYGLASLRRAGAI
jgi:hypothetical protein